MPTRAVFQPNAMLPRQFSKIEEVLYRRIVKAQVMEPATLAARVWDECHIVRKVGDAQKAGHDSAIIYFACFNAALTPVAERHPQGQIDSLLPWNFMPSP